MRQLSRWFRDDPSGSKRTAAYLAALAAVIIAAAASVGAQSRVVGPWSAPQMSGFCTGVATASTTNLTMVNLGGNVFTCTGTRTANSGVLMTHSGTLSNLAVSCATTGVSAASGVFTIYDWPAGGSAAATALTVTYGTATANSLIQDTTHSAAYAAGDRITILFTTQVSETLANCTASVQY